MSDPGQPDNVNRCGNCGSAVSATDIVCPRCGVLLAAYQAPAGASVGTSAATRSISPASTPIPEPDAPAPSSPSPSQTTSLWPREESRSTQPSPLPASPPSSTAPKHTPRSMSPIGDALNRARQTGTTIDTASDQLASADTADELARMASTDSELSRQIDAQLSGAKVTFEGATSTIAPAPDALPAPLSTSATRFPAQSRPDGRQRDAERAGSRPLPTHDSAQSAAIERIRLAREEQRERDAAIAATSSAPSTAVERVRVQHRRRGAAQVGLPTKVLRAAPFILIALFIILGFDRVMAIAGGLIGIGAGLLLLFVLLRLTTRMGRKTTQMPKDDQFNRRR